MKSENVVKTFRSSIKTLLETYIKPNTDLSVKQQLAVVNET